MSESRKSTDSKKSTHNDIPEDEATIVPESAVESAELSLGKPEQIGRYKVLQILGQGAFGCVYLARDDQLDRDVAIKVPHAHMVGLQEQVDSYLAEAKTVAGLDHPHIVPVYDAGSSEGTPFYVVSKFVPGQDLADLIAKSPPSFGESAKLVATLAEALHHAHKKGFVHRDVKPGNILIGEDDRPYLVDFGLALKEQDLGSGPQYAGTPAYMSPEQARGEGHRVDGRSDIFSLGVVLYELLAGRRPFRSSDTVDLMMQIATQDAKPPRQVNDEIPRELERICLKAIAKRASDRYTTAIDFADDLKCYLSEADQATTTIRPATVATDQVQLDTHKSSQSVESVDTTTGPIRIVPKGLRSFDEHDADFFLELLPGARDRNGLPDSIRFWKTKIEETDAEKTFSVGLIYGPSGCGKSSLVKAGLLPRLSNKIDPVFIEATPDETESRLLHRLRKQLPSLDKSLGLRETLASLRRGHGLDRGAKVLIVIDQFEQWLHAHADEQDAELIDALRQCDGEHLQCVLLVRDDFWMAVTRFLHDLEIRLVEGENFSAVDLFPERHARKVLAAFGRAYGVLPEDPATTSEVQSAFLKQAAGGLAEDGKVICVRLALFAEMMKGKDWSTESLAAVGGTKGVGATFLEETFSTSAASPEHRYHEKAARRVLRALLPDSGTDIKGEMKSNAELQEISGYARRPNDYRDLIKLLDFETRIITPTAPEGLDEDSAGQSPHAVSDDRFFQLAHDYIVHPLREWLTRKQKETKRGRAELLLKERSSQWCERPESRFLPSFGEYLSLRRHTIRSSWSENEGRMMRVATQLYLRRYGTLTACSLVLAIVFWVAWHGIRANFEEMRADAIANENRRSADQLVGTLADIETSEIFDVIERLNDYWDFVADDVRELAGASDPKAELHAQLTLFSMGEADETYLVQRLANGEPVEVSVIIETLESKRTQIVPLLWSRIESENVEANELLAAASFLAQHEHDDGRWTDVSPKLARALVNSNSTKKRSQWQELLRPLGKSLVPELVRLFEGFNDSNDRVNSTRAAELLAEYCDDTSTLVDILTQCNPNAFETVFTRVCLRPELARERLIEFIDSNPRELMSNEGAKLANGQVSANHIELLESAKGYINPAFAYCQTLPLDQVEDLNHSLQLAGYQLLRFRPYIHGDQVRVACVWRPSEIETSLSFGMNEQEIQSMHKDLSDRGFVAVDVAGYLEPVVGQEPSARYSAVWSNSETVYSEIFVGLTRSQLDALYETRRTYVASIHSFQSRDGKGGAWGYERYCGIVAAEEGTNDLRWSRAIGEIESLAMNENISDLSFSTTLIPKPSENSNREALEVANEKLAANPEDWNSIETRSYLLANIGKTQEGINGLTKLIEYKRSNLGTTFSRNVSEQLGHRAILLARIGDSAGMSKDLSEIDDRVQRLFYSAYAHFQAGDFEEGEIALEEYLRLGLSYRHLEAAKILGVAAEVSLANDEQAHRAYQERAFAELAKVKNSDAPRHLQAEGFLALPLRRLEGFDERIAELDLDQTYFLIRSGNRSGIQYFESNISVGDEIEESRRAHDEIIGEGYRLHSLTCKEVGDRVVSSSVWHRAYLSEEFKNELADQQARAIIALFRLGFIEEAVDRLAFETDPRRRTRVIHWIREFGGATPTWITEYLSDVELSSESRIALLQALEEYPPQEFDESELNDIVAAVKDCYLEAHAGLHSSAEFLLRRWNITLPNHDRNNLKSVRDNKLLYGGITDPTWDEHPQAGTLIIVPEGTYVLGTISHRDPDVRSNEARREVSIENAFAIGAKPITVRQYRQYVDEMLSRSDEEFPNKESWKTNIERRLKFIRGVVTTDDSPITKVDEQDLYQFLNWLSEKSGIPKDQWCYEKNVESNQLVPHQDIASRVGFRLPTAGEWECACRAGTTTRRHFGHSDEFVGHYGWFAENSENRIWSVGLKKPNDFGLFDTYGNTWEICRGKVIIGGDYLSSHSSMRSSHSFSPAYIFNHEGTGFRVARTLILEDESR